MENKRKTAASENVSGAMEAAAEAASAPKENARGGKKESGFVTMRIEKGRYEELRELFGGKGLAMATAANMALEYVAEMARQGAFTVSRGGIIDLRRR
jgi:hypothetical protein